MSAGVGLLSSELAAAGYDVRVSHISQSLGYPLEESLIARDIRSFEADVFAVSFASSQFSIIPELVRIIRRQRPDSTILCGGVHAMVSPETVIEIPGVDAVCTGEADGLLPGLLECLEEGAGWENTRGFFVRRNGKIYRNQPVPPPDITHQAPLNFSAIDYRNLVRHKSGFAEILLGRGCRFKCTFCQNHHLAASCGGGKAYVRTRAVENVISEMREFQCVAGADLKGFVFGDDSIAYGKEWLGDFLQAYKKEIGLPFIACLLATQVTRPLARDLYHAGCNVIRCGVETGSEALRMGLLGKPVSDRALFRAVRILRDEHINVQGFGMYALPGETREDVMQTLSLAVRLHLDVFRLSTFLPLPETELHRYCVENHLLAESSAGHHDFNTESTLKWPPDDAFFHEKIRYAFPALMNSLLPEPAAKIYSNLVEQLLACGRSDWDALKKQLPELAHGLHLQASASSLPHYYSPVADRSDYAFLFLPERKRKMINIDDASAEENNT